MAGSGQPDTADVHRLDDDRLARWLIGRLDGVTGASGQVRTEKFAGGQSNPTYLVRVGGRPAAVLRKKPPGALLPSAHAVEREYRVTRALAGTGVPVARPVALCEDSSVVGTPFFVMAYVDGRTFWDPRLPELSAGDRRAAYDDMGRVLAALHTVSVERVGLGDYGRPGNYFTRQIDRWSRQYRASETEPVPAMDRLMAWLPSRVPPADETTLVHGDFRVDNLLFHPTKPRVVAVVDWELSTLGHPLADVAYQAMAWHLPPEGFRGMAGEDLAALGIPSEAEYRDAYLARTERDDLDPAVWEFAVVFNLFRNAAIRQGVLHRALAGSASNTQALAAGRLGRDVAERAWAMVEAFDW